jgi:hypothetical protein
MLELFLRKQSQWCRKQEVRGAQVPLCFCSFGLIVFVSAASD